MPLEKSGALHWVITKTIVNSRFPGFLRTRMADVVTPFSHTWPLRTLWVPSF